MAFISIIVPCYNVSAYLDRCMQTLVSQSIGVENLEIILVNDASTDDTLDVMKAWEQKYPEQIMVITYEKNIRQGGARNVGLQYATAEHIGFVDADDWVEPDMYETLYHYAKDGEYDIVRGKFIKDRFPGEHKLPIDKREDQQYHFKKVGKFYQQEITNKGNCGSYGGIWSGLYKRSLIIDNQVFFPEEIAYEDNYWGAILELYTESLYIVDKVVYHYFINMQSTVTTRNAAYHLDRLAIEVGVVEAYKECGAFDLFEKELEWRFVKMFYLNSLHVFFTRFDRFPDVFPYMKETLLQYFPNFRENPHLSECIEIEKLWLSLLDIEDLTIDDLERIRRAYYQ